MHYLNLRDFCARTGDLAIVFERSDAGLNAAALLVQQIGVAVPLIDFDALAHTQTEGLRAIVLHSVPLTTAQTDLMRRQFRVVQPMPIEADFARTLVRQFMTRTEFMRGALADRVPTELARRITSPVTVLGARFDADATARERISGMIARLQRGDGLPAGWLGWRDAENVMHWADDNAETVLAHLTALARAIEDREQALLVTSWQHKAAIAALPDVDAILAYDVAAGW